MGPVVNTLAVHQTLASMVGAAHRSIPLSDAPVNLVTMVTHVSTHACLGTMAKTAVNNASAPSMAVVMQPLAIAAANWVIMGLTVIKSAVRDTLGTTVPRGASARMGHLVTKQRALVTAHLGGLVQCATIPVPGTRGE